MNVADCVFLAIASLASSAWYVTRLGFYSDDWGLIASFKLATDPSLAAILRASFMDRPAQGIYLVLLYRLFGTQPLGYHVVNALVLATVSVLLYIVARRLGAPRAIALAVALLYTTLPNFSTDRFWFAAFAALLSMGFYLLSVLSDLHAAARKGASFAIARATGIGCLLISVLLYETALPLFLLNPVLVWWDRRRNHERGVVPLLHFGAVNILLLSAVAAYKVQTSPRLHAPLGVPALIWSIVTNLIRPGFKEGQYGLNLRAAFDVNYGDYFFRLPAVVWSLHQHYAVGGLAVAALALGIAIFLYMRSIPADFDARVCGLFAAGGVLIFLAGYSMFLTNKAIQITPAGIGNRTSIAAVLGVALSAVGVLGALASITSRQSIRSAIFAALVAGYAAAGFFVVSTLSTFWIDAYGRELEIVQDITTHIDTPPPKTTLMLAGICSYHGPGIIFESDWDLSGALRLHYGDRTLSADILRPGAYAFTNTGIATILYEGEDDYDYGSYLLLYDYRRKTTQALTDKDTAKRIAHETPLDASCAPGMEGVGSPVF